MKKIMTKPWYSIIGYFIITAIDTFIFGLLPPVLRFELHSITLWFYALFTVTLIYSIGWNIIQAIKHLRTRRSSNQDEELEQQRKIEQTELEMVRKSNEILLHLIQDQNRDKDEE